MPKGFDSTMGLGKTQPDESEWITLGDGVVVPIGDPVPTGVNDTALLYNEFVVYDEAQLRIKYILKVKFNFI